MSPTVRLTDQITYNPDTGNHHVTDTSGNVIGDTTQRDVAYRWAHGRATVTSRQRGAMGHVLWHTTRGDYLWCGPGSRLLMIWGNSLITIDHNVANGTYDRERDARDALDRFLAEFASDPS